MLKQLENITDLAVRKQAMKVLKEQVILLEMQDAILWKKKDDGTLYATLLLALPGGHAYETSVHFYYETPTGRTEPVYYLFIGQGEDEISLDSLGQTIIYELAQRRFG